VGSTPPRRLAKVKTRVGEKQGKIVVLGQGGQDQLVTIEFDPSPAESPARG